MLIISTMSQIKASMSGELVIVTRDVNAQELSMACEAVGLTFEWRGVMSNNNTVYLLN